MTPGIAFQVFIIHYLGIDDNEKYRQLLVRTLHSISVRFPDVAPTIIPLLMDFLSDSNELAALDVMNFRL